MSIEFQEDKFEKYNRNTLPGAQVKSSKFAEWLIKKGIVKSMAAANMFLTVVALLIFGISIYIFIFGFNFPG